MQTSGNSIQTYLWSGLSGQVSIFVQDTVDRAEYVQRKPFCLVYLKVFQNSSKEAEDGHERGSPVCLKFQLSLMDSLVYSR